MPRNSPPPGTSPLPEQVLYLDEALRPGATVVLGGAEAEHARRSLRLVPGDPVAVVDGRGALGHGRIMRFGSRTVEVGLERVDALTPWPRRPIILAAGILRTSRMDFLIEKASELGAQAFIPLLADRSVARPRAEGAKEDRWRRLAVESLKQSHRARLMEVGEPVTLEDWLASRNEGERIWAPDPGGVDPAEAALPPGGGGLVLVVGPEGGLSPREAGLLEARGAVRIYLGGHRLRAETAAVASLSLAIARLGELGQPAVVDRGGPLDYD